MSTTMVGKALRAANEQRTKRLDIIASQELGFKVKTTWNMMVGSFGAYVTEREDGAPMAKAEIKAVQMLWAGWAEHEAVMVRIDEKARK